MSLPVNPGDTLSGKYRIERVLGEGGMGVVVAAHHLLLDERVAIKFLLPEAAQSPDAVARFAREARAAAKIHSQHVVRVSDVGTLPDGAAYMVMEYLEGVDLKSEIDRRGPLPCDEMVELMLQALEAMAEAHALGIVHRDLKPANLFLARRRGGATCLKVLDFGISRMMDSLAGATGATATGSVLGTPVYMAPEQWASAKNANVQSDIWSLGAILYHAIAGRAPFTGDSLPTLWHAIANSVPTPLGSLRPDVPSALDAVVARCLQKTPSDRFRSVGDLAKALGPVAPSRARASVERVLALSMPETGAGELAAPTQGPSDVHGGTPGMRTVTAYGSGTLDTGARGQGTRRLVVGVCLALVAAIGGGWLLARRSAPVEETSAATTGEPNSNEAVSTAITASPAPAMTTVPPFVSAPVTITNTQPPSVDSRPAASASASPSTAPSPSSPGRSAPPLVRAAPPTVSPPVSRPAARPTTTPPKKPNADKFE